MMKSMLVGVFALASCLAHAQNETAVLIAHRGGMAEFDENTLAAFQGAYEKGLRGFETDVRMTRDGELVISHDDKLDRTCKAKGTVEEKTAAEARQIRTKQTDQPLLFLDELLACFADKPGVYFEFEMKTSDPKRYPPARLEEYCRKLFKAVTTRQPKGSVYLFSSFDERTLKVVQRQHPEAGLMLITAQPCTPELVKHAQTLGVKGIACTIDGSTRAAVRQAQEAGLAITGWPGKKPDDYLLGIALGVTHSCTDVPMAMQTWKAEHLNGAPGTTQPITLQGKELPWQIIAHRGGRLEFDENTLTAFRGSYEQGLRAFETDIRMARDGTLVVSHDSSLRRIFNSPGTIEQMTTADLAQARTSKRNQPLLFLDEMLDFFAEKPGVMIMFEMKTDPKLYPDARLADYCRKLHDAVTAKFPKGSLYTFSSIDQRALKYFQQHYPETERQLVCGKSRLTDSVRTATALGIRRCGCTLDISTRADVREARKSGMIVTGGTANSYEDYLLGAALGVDNVVSDTPAAIRARQTKAP